jgi:hypothetical protein
MDENERAQHGFFFSSGRNAVEEIEKILDKALRERLIHFLKVILRVLEDERLWDFSTD